MEKKQWGFIISGSFLLGVFVSCIALYPRYKDSIYEQLKIWKVVPLPEPLTELYFEDHLTLPTKVAPGTTVSFRFTIHNIEYKPMVYPYVIRFDGEASAEKLKGSVNLEHDAFKTIDVSLPDSTIATRTAIVVDLPEQTQHIQFWVEPNR